MSEIESVNGNVGIETDFVDLSVGKKTLNFTGEDIFYKLTQNVSRTVNIETAPILVEGADGKLYDPRQNKVGLRNGKITGIVSNRYTFISNEKVYQLIQDAGFKPEKADFDRRGNRMFVQVFSDTVDKANHVWSNDGNGDKVEVGLMVRNSVDGSMAFGGDVFTYRSRCSNGAVIGKTELGSFSVKHAGQYDRLLATFKMYLNRAMELGMKARVYYQKAAEVKMNQDLAEALVNTKLPQKFLPDFISVEESKTILHNKDATVWDTFNGATEKSWHSDVAIGTKRQYTTAANAWLMTAVAPLVKA